MLKERVLFAASAANVRRFINLRPSVMIPDVLASFKLMKSLDPEVVITGYGGVTTTKVFDEYDVLHPAAKTRWRHGGTG